ncbi:jg26534, partial [Pararge aegeria aegeria]
VEDGNEEENHDEYHKFFDRELIYTIIYWMVLAICLWGTIYVMLLAANSVFDSSPIGKLNDLPMQIILPPSTKKNDSYFDLGVIKYCWY